MLEEAADSFQAGRLTECRDRLLAVKLRGFSRLRWYVECNLLACRMQELLRNGGHGLQEVLCSYEMLWQKIRGVPPTADSIGLELCVVLAMCQLLVLLSRRSIMKPHVTTVLERVRHVVSSKLPTSFPSLSLSSMLSTVDWSCFGPQVVRCVEKMRVLCAVLEREEGEAIAAHSRWLDGDQTETCYRQAWLQYGSGDYQSALKTLSSHPLSSSPLSPLYHLLYGACHAKQTRSQLALLHWKKSMETGHTPNHTDFLAALQNCAIAYDQAGNAAAAMASRRIEIETLKCVSESDQSRLPLWVWLDDKVGGATHRSLADALYSLAWHAINTQQYEVAGEALLECIEVVRNGAPVKAVPLPSTLHLLRAHCEVCGGEDVRRGKVICEEFICSPSVSPLWRSEVMCILATACLQLGECGDSCQWSLKCLAAVEEAMGEQETNHNTVSRLQLLQQHAHHLLALGAIAHAQWREALQLLSCVVATPTGLYNHCLLQCKVGVVMGGASGWLKRRGKMPAGRCEARDMLREARSMLDHDSDKNFVAMDIAMLSLWLQHNCANST